MNNNSLLEILNQKQNKRASEIMSFNLNVLKHGHKVWEECKTLEERASGIPTKRKLKHTMNVPFNLACYLLTTRERK